MDDQLRNLMQELGSAINDSLSESDRIAEAIGEIKRAGYDVFLVLEATIGFNRESQRRRLTRPQKWNLAQEPRVALTAKSS